MVAYLDFLAHRFCFQVIEKLIELLGLLLAASAVLSLHWLHLSQSLLGLTQAAEG